MESELLAHPDVPAREHVVHAVGLDRHPAAACVDSKLYRRGSKFFVGEEIGTMNATFLNGNRLETGIPSEIQPGDELRFGVVVMRFAV